jgi:hypothetical protein
VAGEAAEEEEGSAVEGSGYHYAVVVGEEGGSKCSEGRCLAGKSWAGSCAESGRGTSGVTALAAPECPTPSPGACRP